MAGSIKKHKNKDGKTVYYLQAKVYDKNTKNYEYAYDTWEPEGRMTEKQQEKKAREEADKLHKALKKRVCGSLNVLSKASATFEEFSEIWLENSDNNHALSYNTTCRNLLKEINQSIGHYKLCELDQFIIQDYYDKLDKKVRIVETITPKPDIKENLISKGFGYNRLRYDLEIQHCTLSRAYNGMNVSRAWAETLCEKTGIPFDELFTSHQEKEKYAFETIDKYKRTICSVLSLAQKKGFVQINYAKSEYLTFPKKPRSKTKSMSEEEAQRFVSFLLDEYDDIKGKTALLSIILTGMRKGEAAALEWSDVDFDKCTIDINKAIVTITGHGAKEGTPKSDSSFRNIEVTEILFSELSKYKEWQDEQREILGDQWIESNKIITNTKGGPIHPSYYNYHLNKVLEKGNFQHYTVHELRHTFINLLHEEGYAGATLSASVGHSKPSVTSNIYSHKSTKRTKALAEKIGNILAPKYKLTNDISPEDLEALQNMKSTMADLGISDMQTLLEFLKFQKLKSISSLNN